MGDAIDVPTVYDLLRMTSDSLGKKIDEMTFEGTHQSSSCSEHIFIRL
jgi:hypothetical protein